MKRYNITAEVNSIAEDHGLITGRIKIDGADNGEWIRYEDVKELLQSVLVLNDDGCVRSPYVEDFDVSTRVSDSEFLKEMLK